MLSCLVFSWHKEFSKMLSRQFLLLLTVMRILLRKIWNVISWRTILSLENQELHFIAILLRALSDPRGDKD